MADPGFSPGGAPTPKIAIIFHIFAENCMKMKEFGPPGGARVPGAPPLDPPMLLHEKSEVGDWLITFCACAKIHEAGGQVCGVKKSTTHNIVTNCHR